MGTWREAYEMLPEAQQERVQRWIQLQGLIAESLGMSFDRWIEDYVGGAMAAPFDYRFMEVTAPGFAGLDTDGATFSRETDPATARVARVPVRSANQLGRLSNALQDALTDQLGDPSAGPLAVAPGDVATLQKIFPAERGLARLKRKDFRKVRFVRTDTQIRLEVEGENEPLLAQDLFAFSSALNKPRV
ncbi:MAG: hypothetical protein AAFU79_15325 [Myxococcota bacterium]